MELITNASLDMSPRECNDPNRRPKQRQRLTADRNYKKTTLTSEALILSPLNCYKHNVKIALFPHLSVSA